MRWLETIAKSDVPVWDVCMTSSQGTGTDWHLLLHSSLLLKVSYICFVERLLFLLETVHHVAMIIMMT